MLAILGASLTIAFGLFGALRPRVAASVVGIVPLGALGMSEVRATYGGLFIALGLACLLLNDSSAYSVAASAWSGAACLRIVSFILEKDGRGLVIGGFLIELVMACLLFSSVI